MNNYQQHQHKDLAIKYYDHVLIALHRPSFGSVDCHFLNDNYDHIYGFALFRINNDGITLRENVDDELDTMRLDLNVIKGSILKVVGVDMV